MKTKFKVGDKIEGKKGYEQYKGRITAVKMVNDSSHYGIYWINPAPNVEQFKTHAAKLIDHWYKKAKN